MEFLVGVDGSAESKNALEWAVEMAAGTGASLTVIHVVVPAVFDEGGEEPVSVVEADTRLIQEGLESAERRGYAVIEDVEELASNLGHEVRTELIYGDPAAGILSFAEQGTFDAIFVGHRGRGTRAELLLGSVAKRLVERARVPVTVVH